MSVSGPFLASTELVHSKMQTDYSHTIWFSICFLLTCFTVNPAHVTFIRQGQPQIRPKRKETNSQPGPLRAVAAHDHLGWPVLPLISNTGRDIFVPYLLATCQPSPKHRLRSGGPRARYFRVSSPLLPHSLTKGSGRNDAHLPR